MRIGASILLITLGAIIALALRVEPRGVDLDAVGWILMLVGAAGLVLNHFVWERRKEAGEFADSPDVFVDPDAGPSVYQHPHGSHDPRITEGHRIAKDHRSSE
jgi:hypothetical protein